MPLGQPVIDLWTLILRIAKWAARIPLAVLVIFAAGCVSYLGFYFVFRATVWLWENFLKNPW